MLIISAGMPKSGSGWYFNLINDLLVEYGFDDVRMIKERYGLEEALRFYNCNIGILDKESIDRILPVIIQGHTFVIKTHSGPGDYLRKLQDLYPVRTTYLYRDPRAVALSAYNHGEKQRREEKEGSFAGITTFESSINYASHVHRIWKEWVDFPEVFLVKYESLIGDPAKILEQFLFHIGMDPDVIRIQKVLAQNLPGKKEGTHFNIGEATRFTRVWTKEQLAYANTFLKEVLSEMGYE